MESLKSSKHYLTITSLLLVLSAGITIANVVHTAGLPPPKNVNIAAYPFGETLTPTSATIRWDKVDGANNYLVVIFKTHEDEVVLHEEVKNVPSTRVKFEDLTPSTTYEVVVSSLRVHLNGKSEQSKEATRFRFTTRNGCTGRMIFVPCSAHCRPTCTNQYPACDRRCISGCTCPSETPFWHNEQCISNAGCKQSGAPPTEVVRRPTGLKFHKIKGKRDLLFTWNKVKGADHYRVIVALRDGTEVQRHDRIKAPVLIIKGLKPGTSYKFKVHAVFIKSSASSRTLILGMLPMTPPEISRVTNTSFLSKWATYPGATGFKMIIYDGLNGEILQIFRDLTENFVTVQGLSPGTTYGVSVMAITTLTEVESATVSVTTIGQGGLKSSSPDALLDEVIHIIQETTTTPAPTTTTSAPYVPTCEEVKLSLEAFHGDGAGPLPATPACDEGGNYAPTQCRSSGCYCVEKVSGNKIDGTDFDNMKSEFALDCDKYGQFAIKPLAVKALKINTTSIRVRWVRITEATFYIVKIFNGFEGSFVKSISKIKKHYVDVGGLERGTPYVAVVAAVNAQGWTSTTANVTGRFVATPHLDPPSNVRLEQFTTDKMKVSWRKDEIALSYEVRVYGNGVPTPTKYKNVTDNHLIFQVYGEEPYRVKIKSTGVATIPGTRNTVVVTSNEVTISRRPTCVFPPLDVIFVIDVSNRMTPEEYAKSKLMYLHLLTGLTPIASSANDPTGTRFAAVKTYGVSRTMFYFDRFLSSSNAWGAVRFVRQTKSQHFDVDRMVDRVYADFFAPGKRSGPRRNVQTAVISFIGDISITRSPDFDTKTERLRSATNYITVAVDPDISNGHANQNKIVIPSYNNSKTAYDLVMTRLCNLK